MNDPVLKLPKHIARDMQKQLERLSKEANGDFPPASYWFMAGAQAMHDRATFNVDVDVRGKSKQDLEENVYPQIGATVKRALEDYRKVEARLRMALAYLFRRWHLEDLDAEKTLTEMNNV